MKAEYIERVGNDEPWVPYCVWAMKIGQKYTIESINDTWLTLKDVHNFRFDISNFNLIGEGTQNETKKR